MMITIWTATTDGDNAPLTTTVHAQESHARARVFRDLLESGIACGQRERDDTAALAESWRDQMDGACLIEDHAIEIAP